MMAPVKKLKPSACDWLLRFLREQLVCLHQPVGILNNVMFDLKYLFELLSLSSLLSLGIMAGNLSSEGCTVIQPNGDSKVKYF